MATELAKAYVQIIPSAKGIRENLSKALGGESEAAGHSAGERFGGKMVAGIKRIIAAAGIGKALAATIHEGAELQQNLGGTEAVFGQFAQSIQSAAADAYKNMGLSASDYMATANKMGSLFQGSGLEQQRALELTSRAMQRAADVASVMGIDTSMAMESIAGAAKGNFTMMDNLGVAMNATTLEAYALEKGVNFQWNTASNAEKAELAMQMFFDRTSQYAGNFARESEETLSGSLGAVKAAFSNVLGQLTLGQDIAPALSALAQTVTAFLTQNLLPALWNILSALPGALAGFLGTAALQLADALASFLPQVQADIIQELPKMLEAAQKIIEALCTGFSRMWPRLLEQGGEILTQLIDGVAALLPRVWQMALDIVTGFINTFIENYPQYIATGAKLLLSLIGGIRTALPQMLTAAAEAILSMVKGLIQNFPQILSAGFEMIVSLIRGIGNALPDIISAAGEIAAKLWDTILETDWLALGKDLVRGLIDGIGAMGGALWDAATNMARSALNAIKSFLGIRSPSRVMRDKVGKFIPLGVAAGIERNQGPLSAAMHDMQELVTGTLHADVTTQLRAQRQAGAAGPALADGSGTVTNFYQTIHTHDSLSESELTREAKDLLDRTRWKNP